MTEQQTITEFITARLDEDHYRAYQAQGLLGIPTPWWTWRHLRNRFGTSITHADALHIGHHGPARVLREVEAKRAILELADEATGLDMSVDIDRGIGPRDKAAEPYVGDLIIRQMAQAYSDHPDYNPEWSIT